MRPQVRGFVMLCLAAFLAPPALHALMARADDSVWVSRSDHGVSCKPGSKESLESGLRDLKAAQVSVRDYSKGHDGKLHPFVCGAPTGTENAYRISRKDLEKAIALGFKVAPAPADAVPDVGKRGH